MSTGTCKKVGKAATHAKPRLERAEFVSVLSLHVNECWASSTVCPCVRTPASGLVSKSSHTSSHMGMHTHTHAQAHEHTQNRQDRHVSMITVFCNCPSSRCMPASHSSSIVLPVRCPSRHARALSCIVPASIHVECKRAGLTTPRYVEQD